MPDIFGFPDSQVMPQPLPLTHTIADVMFNGVRQIVVIFDTPAGRTIVWFDPDAFREFLDRGRMTLSGLTVANNNPPRRDG